MKKNAQAARKMISMLSRMGRVAWSNARRMAFPTTVPSTALPVKRPSSDSPVSNSRSGQRTFSSPTGCDATS
jgi:hypothetical protein